MLASACISGVRQSTKHGDYYSSFPDEDSGVCIQGMVVHERMFTQVLKTRINILSNDAEGTFWTLN